MAKPNKVLISTFSAFALSALFAVSAAAQPMNRLAEKLGLTEAQQQSLTQIREQKRAAREEQLAQREAIAAANKSGDVETAAELAANQARERVYRKAEMRSQIAAILTPEQLEQWDAMQENRSRGDGAKGEKGKRGRRGQRQPKI